MHEYNEYNASGQTTYTSTADVEVDRAPTITDEFNFALEDLRKTLAELTIRLQPVLRPLAPEAEQRGSDPMPPVSALRDRLYYLHATTGEVRRLLDRLDV